MKLQFFAFAVLFILQHSIANAQMLNRPVNTLKAPEVATVKDIKETSVSLPSQPTITAQDIIDQVNAEQAEEEANPIAMTPAEKAAVKKPLVEQIMNDVDKASLKERRELIKVIEQIQKAQIRLQNLSLPEDKQIKYEEPRINAASKEDVQKYLQDKLVAPLDRVMNIQ
ncbi:MAG: hypothetical protein IJW72_03750 [Alphaproteobacteria bacterium]|nr:hypothetical protein [Alphaproteobacteria bacterium]